MLSKLASHIITWLWRLLVLLFLYTFFCGIWWFTSRLAFQHQSPWYLGEALPLTLDTTHTLQQKFTATEDNLKTIRLSLAENTTLRSHETLTLEVHDSYCKSTLRSITLDTTQLLATNTATFTFEPIPHSKEDTYCLQFLFSSSDSTRSITINTLSNKTTKKSKYFLDDFKADDSSIVFWPAYGDPSWQTNLTTLTNRLSQYKPLWIKGQPLLWLGILTLMGTLFFLVTAMGVRRTE